MHKELGGIPEACSVFSLLKFHCTDEKFVSDIYKQYKNGDLMMKDLKKITTDFIVKLVIEHQDKKKKIDNVDSFLLKTPLRSIL